MADVVKRRMVVWFMILTMGMGAGAESGTIHNQIP